MPLAPQWQSPTCTKGVRPSHLVRSVADVTPTSFANLHINPITIITPEMSRRELVGAQPGTSRAAGDRKQTADLTAAQLSHNQELVDKFRGKMVSHCSHLLTMS